VQTHSCCSPAKQTDQLIVLIADCFFTSPAGAVAKYCDEYVCLSVCLAGWPRGYLWNHMRDLYQIFCACCLCPWLGAALDVDDRPHHLSVERGWRECTVRADCNLDGPVFCCELWLFCELLELFLLTDMFTVCLCSCHNLAVYTVCVIVSRLMSVKGVFHCAENRGRNRHGTNKAISV